MKQTFFDFKKTIAASWGGLLLLFVFGLTSCSESYLKTIPKDAVILAKVDVKSMAEKSALAENPSFNKLMNDMDDFFDAETSAKMKNFMDGPASMGLDLREPLLVAVSPNGGNTDDVNITLSAKVHDADDFASFLKSVDVPVEKYSDYSLVTIDRSTTLAFDKNSLVLCVSESGKSALDYLDLDESQQALKSVDGFDQFLKESGDICLSFLPGSMVDAIKNGENESELEFVERIYGSADNLKDAYYCVSLTFEDGQIEMESKIDGSKGFKEQMTTYTGKGNTKYLELVPGSAWAVYQVNIDDFAKMFALICGDDLHHVLDELEISSSDFNQLKEVSLCAAALPEAQLGNQKYLQAMVMASATPAIWNVVKNLMSEEGCTRVADNVFALNMNSSYHGGGRNGDDYYLGYVDNTIFFMPESNYRNVAQGGLHAARGNAAADPLLKKVADGGFAIDFQKVNKEFYANLFCSRSDANVFTYIINKFASIEVVSNSDKVSTSGKISFTDKSKNALAQIADIVFYVINCDNYDFEIDDDIDDLYAADTAVYMI